MDVKRSTPLSRTFAAGAALVVLFASAPGIAPAEAGPLVEISGESLDVTADKLDVDTSGGTALLEGNVKAVLGDLVVTCPKVEVRYDQAPRVSWARGSGGVRASLKGIEAKADVVELDLGSRKLTLGGGVRLARGKGWVNAKRASIDLDTKKLTLHEVEGSIPVERPQR